MSKYVLGVLVGFLEPILHGWANILDNYFSNKVFPHLSVLLFFGTALNVLFLPFVLFFSPADMLALKLLGITFVIGLINVLYLFPYYWALRHTDTSIVAALFSLGKIFVPILAFYVLGERLAPLQYVGFGIIVLSVIALTLDFKSLRFNRAFFLMIGVSFSLALQAILYKYVFDTGATWGSVVAALTAIEFLIAGAIMLAVNTFSEIIEDFKKIRQSMGLFVAQQGLEWGGNVSSSFAVSVLPVTTAQAIVSTQPLFVLVYAGMFGKKFSDFFKESTSAGDIIRKTFLFGLTILGTILVVANGISLDI